MSFQFTIPELLSMGSKLRYNPQLAVAVNRVLNANSKVDYEIALREATAAAIGYEPKVLDEAKSNADYDKSNHFPGLPIFHPLIIKATEQGEKDLVLDSAVVTYNRQRNIVETVVQNRDTTIKEFINNGSWTFSVTGILCRNGNIFPRDLIVEWDRFMSKKQSLPIVHEVLNAIGIYEMVVKDYSMQPSPYINCQPYTFNAVQDTPIELQINDLAEAGI